MNSNFVGIKCPHCGEKISGNPSVCPKCGGVLGGKDSVCAKCGKNAPADANFCPACGSPLAGKRGESGTKPSHGKRKLGLWIPVISIILLISICLGVFIFGNWGSSSDLMASRIETVIVGNKATQTPLATTTPTKTPTQTSTSTFTPTPSPVPAMPPTEAKLKDTWASPMDGMELAYIPHGQFLIGSLDSDPQSWLMEKPQHRVELSGYWMDKTEITNAMYAKCIQSGACPAKKMRIANTRESYFGDAKFDNYPVIYVTWEEAQTYCAWAGRKLPTEAQWEAAARGSDGRLYPWGNAAPTCNVVNYAISVPTDFSKSNYCTGDTTAVGKYPKGASPFAVLDMAGNVWEWVADWESPNYLVEPHLDPTGFSTGENRVIRGGSYFNDAKYIRAAMRSSHEPTDATNYIGFRCAR
jgi:formylglycine-generating enzyme required for sulfatase activity